ncbi:hypothetical protein GRU3_10 [Gordonia phage GRU3]|uniref:Uncharacterized protein n=1 Tax=Gordonia phage GRU3 TaxID=1647473 RepID=A0A0K0N5N9_9CAUD|nr:hypothetical protein BH785_gp10 [Gordonia phage GRU3]AKJ72259.1 hypothetical protein GRU3_10 [Gordonia phage GRU3]
MRVIGDRRVQIGLARIAADLKLPTPALRETTDAVARTASRLAAKRTGRLSRANRGSVAGATGRVTNRTRYAGFQENGTRYMNAHPFMAPAARLTDAESIFEDYADRVIHRHL